MTRENSVLDQSRDLDGRELYRLASLYPPPAWVKSASAAELCGDQLPAHLYASPKDLLYPTHTRAATWASALFFADKQASFRRAQAGSIRDRIEKAADFHGVGPDVRALFEKAAELSRHDDASLPDDAFAYVGPAEGGGKERRLRLINPGEVKAAAEWLFRHRDDPNMPYPDRQKIAAKVLLKANELGASVGDLDDFLEKTAGHGGCPCSDAVAATRQRAALLRARHPDASEGLEKLAVSLAADPKGTRTPERLQKLAATLEVADRLARVEYGGTVRRPEDVLFQITRKQAESLAMSHVPSPSGTVYAVEDLGRMKVATLRAHMGDEVADAVTSDGLHVDPTKLAEVMPSFTRPDAEMFDRMAKSMGILARFKEAASERQGLSEDDIRALAASHTVD